MLEVIKEVTETFKIIMEPGDATHYEFNISRSANGDVVVTGSLLDGGLSLKPSILDMYFHEDDGYIGLLSVALQLVLDNRKDEYRSAVRGFMTTEVAKYNTVNNPWTVTAAFIAAGIYWTSVQ